MSGIGSTVISTDISALMPKSCANLLSMSSIYPNRSNSDRMSIGTSAKDGLKISSRKNRRRKSGVAVMVTPLFAYDFSNKT